MSTTPSQQPTASQPEKSTDTTKQSGLKLHSIEVVSNDRVRIEFQIEDLVNRLIENMLSPNLKVAACSGCSACSASIDAPERVK